MIRQNVRQRMGLRLALLAYLTTVALVFGREQSSTNAPLSLEQVRTVIAAHLNQDRFQQAQWGVKIVSLQSGALLFETNAEKLLKPASNAKLFTGALALDQLGPGYKIRTSLYAAKAPENGVLKGDLIVYGRGDPSFSHTFGETNALNKIVRAIRSAGIQRIEGDLVGDSTFFSGPVFGSGWGWDDLQYYYGAEVTALCAEDNVVDLTIRPGDSVGAPCHIESKATIPFVELINRTTTVASKIRGSISIERAIGQNHAYVSGSLAKGASPWTDSISVANAPLWFVSLLKEELTRAGVVVTGNLRVIAAPENPRSEVGRLKEVASVTSVDIGTIVHKMMKASQNLYAQLLLLQVGATAPNQQNATTEEAGLKRLADFVQQAGIRPEQVRLEDGAGLSRAGLVSPAATVQLLRYMARHKTAELFRDSLPEAGTDGTLRNRLKELKGKLHAKTGTIRYVNTLSGYITTAGGEELAFSLMLNAYDPPSGPNSRDEIDAIPRLLARLGERIGPENH
jgi:D-alanyl-D-alanine carboxypeptidase/D-alanyl-D-alanine-endopeptidase (penicillin-binding protein 4)